MPYVAGEYRINVRGNIASGEIWNNTWCVIDPTGVQDVNEAGNILNLMYEDLYGFAAVISDQCEHVGATATALASGLTQELTWSGDTGSSAAGLLPTQLGVRVSLRSALVNGGPYLCGFAKGALAASGLLDGAAIANIVTALETMTGALTAAGWQLGLDQPTAELATAVTGGRIGQRFDVIRKRANDIAEAYTNFGVA